MDGYMPDSFPRLVGGEGRFENRAVHFVRLPRSIADGRVRAIAPEASVVRANIVVRGEVAATQKNRERRYHQQALHLIHPWPAAPMHDQSVSLNI